MPAVQLQSAWYKTYVRATCAVGALAFLLTAAVQVLWPNYSIGNLTIINWRNANEFHPQALRLGARADGAPMHMRGRLYESGIGAAMGTDVWLLPDRSGHFSGACGIDDGSNDVTIQCIVLDSEGRELFRSAPLTRGMPPAEFSALLPASGIIQLRAHCLTALPICKETFVNWVGISVSS